jgi:hypothetical protein
MVNSLNVKRSVQSTGDHFAAREQPVQYSHCGSGLPMRVLAHHEKSRW